MIIRTGGRAKKKSWSDSKFVNNSWNVYKILFDVRPDLIKWSLHPLGSLYPESVLLRLKKCTALPRPQALSHPCQKHTIRRELTINTILSHSTSLGIWTGPLCMIFLAAIFVLLYVCPSSLNENSISFQGFLRFYLWFPHPSCSQWFPKIPLEVCWKLTKSLNSDMYIFV